MIVFSTQRYDYLRDALCSRPLFVAGEVERKTFPDDEKYRRVVTDVSGEDVVLLGGTVDDADTLEIYDLACCLVHRGAHTFTMAIPWFGYQTMEREVIPGEVVTAKTRARLLSAVPIAGSGNRAIMIDLHSEGITQYFSGNIRPVHLYAKPVVLDLIRELAGDDEFVLASTDAGRAKWVESLANDLGVDAGFVFKRRVSGGKTEVTALAADVSGKTVIIYDDMIRTGGSLLGAARSFLDAGAKQISAVCTHGVFPGDALGRLRQSKLLNFVGCTDTHPRAVELASQTAAKGFLRVESVAPLLANALLANAISTSSQPA